VGTAVFRAEDLEEWFEPVRGAAWPRYFGAARTRAPLRETTRGHVPCPTDGSQMARALAHGDHTAPVGRSGGLSRKGVTVHIVDGECDLDRAHACEWLNRR